jgi:hypothetical protein
MTMSKIAKEALMKLVKAVPPPGNPVLATGDPSAEAPQLPDDYLELIGMYGSGCFDVKGVGTLVNLLNPHARNYWKKVQEELDLIREYKAEEGDDYIPYRIHPDTPGLLIWGYGEGRKHYFWVTKGKPAKWPTVVMYDIEEFTEFDTPMVMSLQRLLCGEVECKFLGLSIAMNRIDPSTVSFHPRISDKAL